MQAEPLPKELFDKLKAAGIVRLVLHFSGGNDEGYLNIVLHDGEKQVWGKKADGLDEDVDKWAWEAYQYSGAGDGSDYGDDIEYDLVKMTVNTSEWYMARQDGDASEGELDIAE